MDRRSEVRTAVDRVDGCSLPIRRFAFVIDYWLLPLDA
jgi:hypothetical protein